MDSGTEFPPFETEPGDDLSDGQQIEDALSQITGMLEVQYIVKSRVLLSVVAARARCIRLLVLVVSGDLQVHAPAPFPGLDHSTTLA